MTTKTVTLYINQGGMVSCRKHGGSYLDSYLEAHPNAKVIDTPLDNWVRLTAADLAEFDDVQCESARFGTTYGRDCE